MMGKRMVRECPILVAMSVVTMMPGLGNNGQRRNAHNGKLAKHLERCRPLAMELAL